MLSRRGAVAAALIACAAPGAALACEAQPRSQRIPSAELVAAAQIIVLARAAEVTGQTSDRSGGPIMRLETLETLKGAAPETFTLHVTFDPTNAARPDFNGHRDPIFWHGYSFNPNDTHCGIDPELELGATYLVFLDHPHIRGYERIETEDDLWLGAVRAMIADPSRDHALEMTLAERLDLYSGAFIGVATACDIANFRVETVLRGDFAEEWPGTPYPLPIRSAGCAVGARHLVLTNEDNAIAYPGLGARAHRIDNGRVDLGALFPTGEIKALGPTVVGVAAAAAALRAE